MSWIEDLLARIATVDTVVDAIKLITDVLPDAGALTTIDTNVDDIETLVGAITAGGPSDAEMDAAIALCAQIADGWDAALATILDNFTAGRITNLDELGAGAGKVPADIDTLLTRITEAVATAAALAVVDTNVDDIETAVTALEASSARQLFTMDFWSLPQEEVAVTVGAGDKGLPSVTVAELPGGAVIVRAIAMFKFRMVENHTYAGENSLDGAQVIQVAASVDAINFVATQFTLAETTREGGDVVIGAIDIAATVSANGAYAFHWDLAKALQTGINFNDIQMGLRIWYSV